MQQPADQKSSSNLNVQLTVGTQFDQYEIESVINTGDFRITYYAWDNRRDCNVVIHEYFPSALAARDLDGVTVMARSKDRFNDFEFGLSEFLLEARLISQIDSAYLPNIIEYREANGTGYLISEFDDGLTLRQLLDKEKLKLNNSQLTEILRSGLQGLRELHARNLLHTSICPENLFIRNQGHPLILGQGLARYRLAQYTKTYTVSLKPGYTPLEQYGLDGNIGPWSDLYALGASLYECIARIRPVDASTRHTAIIKGEDDPLTPAVELGKGEFSQTLLSNIDGMLKPYVEDRPDSADLMLGIVNFQKLNAYKYTTIPVSAGYDATGSELDNMAAVRSAGDRHAINEAVDAPPIDTPQVNTNRSGGFFYWSLGLAFFAFLALTGYQIYQHELKQNELSAAAIPTQRQPLPEQDEQAVQVPPEQVENQPQNAVLREAQDREISKETDEQRREFYQNLVNEEEIERRVEEEIKAMEAEQLAQQAVQAQALQSQINDLIDKAAQAKNRFRLLKPEGESAYDFYSQVLDLKPNDEMAITGLNEIADRYFALTLKALENKDPNKANQHLSDLIKVRPNDPRMAGFLRQITDLKAELKLQQEKLSLIGEPDKAQQNTQQNNQEDNQQGTQAEAELAAPVNPDNSTSSPASDTIVNAQTRQDSPIVEVEENDDTPAQTDQRAAVEVNTEPAPPKLSRRELAAAYQTYDKGQYSRQLFKTLLEAANQNEGRAQYILAEMYAAGRGIEQNIAQSSQWLKRSLDHVNTYAKYRQPWAEKAIGVIYEKGWYVDADTARAVRWYRSSADKNYSPAQYRLGLAYAKGLGVKKDLQQAEFWFKKALSNGHQEAKRALSKLPAQN